MQFSRFLAAPGFLGLATLSAMALLGSCERSTSSTDEPSGPQSVTYEAELAELPGTWALPDSIRWTIDGNAKVAKLQVDDLDVIVSADLSSPPTDTVDIALFRAGLRYAMWHFRYRGSADLAVVGGKVDSLALELLRRAGKDATPESIRVVLVKALVDVDSFLIRHPYPKNMPVGIDSAAVLREYAIRVAASGRSFAQVAKSATLPVDTTILRKMIRSLAIWGDIEDTTSIFPPPAKLRDTTITPRDTTRPRDSTIVPRDTTKPRDSTIVPRDTTRPRDSTIVPRDTTRPRDSIAPSLRILSPLMDTHMLFGADSLAVVAWLVTDDAGIDSVWIDKRVVTVHGDTASARIILRYGPNRIAISARDVNGNIARDSILVVVGDNVAPRLERLVPTFDTILPNTAKSCTVSWSVTDNVRLERVTINGTVVAGVGGIYSRTVPLVVDTNRIVAIATDSAGNVSKDTIVISRKPDDVPPVLTRLMVHKGDSLVRPGVTFIRMSWGVIDDDSIAKVTINDSLASRVNQTSRYSSNNLPLVFGSNSFVIIATDVSGNVSRDTVTVTRIKDTVPPTLTRNTGTTDTTVGYFTALFSAAWTVRDQFGLDKVTVNDSVFSLASSVYKRVISLKVGENRIVISAMDDFGNTASDTIRVVRKPDTSSPQIVRMTGTGDRTFETPVTSTTLSWKVTDDVVVKSVTLAEGDRAPVLVTPAASVYSRTVTLERGANKFVIIATDSSGNISSDTVTITCLVPTEVATLHMGARVTEIRTSMLWSSRHMETVAIRAPSAPILGKDS